jgi:hypothetical protein
MITPFTKTCTDCSEKDHFSFAFYCDRCGSAWRSTPVPFSKGGFTEVGDDETLKLLWADEHRAAFERANIEAMFHFNHCNVCGKWVCNDCFYTSEDDYTDVCKDCHEDTGTEDTGTGLLSCSRKIQGQQSY